MEHANKVMDDRKGNKSERELKINSATPLNRQANDRVL